MLSAPQKTQKKNRKCVPKGIFEDVFMAMKKGEETAAVAYKDYKG